METLIPNLNSAASIVMIDFETSGMSPETGARVTEVAAIRLHQGMIVDRFVSLINCRVRIPSMITQLTGITQSMVDRAPPVEQVIPQLIEFIGEDYLAAHNASFDEKFLLDEAARLGLVARHRGVICSVKLARRVFPGLASYSLGKLAAQLDVSFNGRAHRAEADAEVAAQIILLAEQRLRQHWDLAAVHPDVLIKINRLSSAKVPAFLKSLTSQSREQPRPSRAPLPILQNEIKPQLYRHYKGGIYELLCEATQESDLTPIIVYRSHNGTIWTRPRENFFEQVLLDGVRVPRFHPIDEVV